jgi:hypothetical protein
MDPISIKSTGRFEEQGSAPTDGLAVDDRLRDSALGASCLEEPFVVDPAGRAAAQVRGYPRIGSGRILPCELEIDVRVDEFECGFAAWIPRVSYEQVLESELVGHGLTGCLLDRMPRFEKLLRSLVRASSKAL